MRTLARVAATLLLLSITAPLSVAAATTAPSPAPRASPVVIHLPNVPLHTEYLVEVNKYGQVVRVKSSKPSKYPTFNVQTYGNALQMWIRKPDGSAEVGLFRVSYDYDPKTKFVHRSVALVSEGGTWANDEGAANRMMDLAKKEAAEAKKRTDAQSSSLPSLNEITGKSPRPSASP